MAGTSRKKAPKSSPREDSRPAEELIKGFKSYAESFQGIFRRKELRAARLDNPVAVSGKEFFRIRRVASLIAETLKLPLHSYYPGDLTDSRVLEELKSEVKGGSLFSASKVVAIFEADSIRQGSADRIAELFLPDISNVLFIVCYSNTKPKWLECESFAIQSLAGAQLSRWIEKELERNSHRGGIDQAALALLVNSFGEDAKRLSSEIGKLCLYVGEDERIALSHVKSLCLSGHSGSAFDLLEACAAENAVKALMVLKNLEEQGQHPLQILALLSKSVRTLLAKLDKGSGALHSDISSYWVIKNTPLSQRKFTREKLSAALSRIAQLDLELKGSKREGIDLLKDFAISLSSAREGI
jgi:DNA polymerase III delta subunit